MTEELTALAERNQVQGTVTAVLFRNDENGWTVLTLDSDGEAQLAQDTELSYSGNTASPEDYARRSKTVLVDGASGDETVVIRRVYPTYRGALVVCQGGGRAEVRLAVTEAVAAVTGLPSDRVTVAKWQ